MSVADDELMRDPDQPACHPVAEKVIQAAFDAAEKLLRAHGAVPPPAAHLFIEEYSQPYVGSISTRPFRYGADAAAAIARLGLLPSVLLATRVVFIWEHADLLTGLTKPGQNYPHALAAVEATFTTHTMTWRPFTVDLGPPSPHSGLPVCYPRFSAARVLSAPALPQPISDAIATWRQLRMHDDMDATFAVLQAEGYRIDLTAPTDDPPAEPEPDSYETDGPAPRALIRRAWQEVGDALSARQPGQLPSEGYLRGTVTALEWALGMSPRTGPLLGIATGEEPTVADFKREAEFAYEQMHRLGPGAEGFEFVVGVENTTMWLATGRGLYLG